MRLAARGERAMSDCNHGLRFGPNGACPVCERDRLRAALEIEAAWWEDVPCGVEQDPDPGGNVEADDVAWMAGVAIRRIREVLDGDPSPMQRDP
jgi:hypothetical protein